MNGPEHMSAGHLRSSEFDALRQPLLDAYERGRRRVATWRAVYVLPFGAFAFSVLGASIPLTLAITALLGIVFGATQHLGTAIGRGGRVGLGFGIVPLLSPWIVQSNHLCCVGGSCSTNCLEMCAAGGFLAGIGFALMARRDPSPLRYALGGGAVMLAASALGCGALEWGGMLGVAAGLLATLPVLVTARAAA